MRVLACQRVKGGDGVEMGTDVYLPDGQGRYPTLLTRTPYNRNGLQATGAYLAARGYAFVAQDCRGRFDATGRFVPLMHEMDDGQATLDWIANASWCNGRIGLTGTSYCGIVQIPIAAGGHPALATMAPVAAPQTFFREWVRTDGCFSLANAVRWSMEHATSLNNPPCLHVNWNRLWSQPTLAAMQEMAGFMPAHLRDWIAHDRMDDYWQAADQHVHLKRVRIPALHMGGWYDHISRSQFWAFEQLADLRTQAQERPNQHLLIGPWGHMTLGTQDESHRKYGDWDFGPNAMVSLREEEMAFHDFHLREVDNGFQEQPRVRVFVMGLNRWHHGDHWPPRNMHMQAWHLRADRHIARRGSLGPVMPDHDGVSHWTYDPSTPAPTLGGAIYWGMGPDHPCGPVDQRPLLGREDVLCFTSRPFDRPLTIIGEPAVELTFSSDTEDTDLMVKLCVQQIDGGIRPIANGSLRLRYRESFAQSLAIPRDQLIRVRIMLCQTAYQFAAGQCAVLIITSSDFPRINAHLNTMEPPLSGTPAVVGHHCLHHGPGMHSRLLLPVIASESCGA